MVRNHVPPTEDRQRGKQLLKSCPACGAIGYTEDQFCACCGAEMPESCPECGEIIRQTIAFYCPHCGRRLER